MNILPFTLASPHLVCTGRRATSCDKASTSYSQKKNRKRLQFCLKAFSLQRLSHHSQKLLQTKEGEACMLREEKEQVVGKLQAIVRGLAVAARHCGQRLALGVVMPPELAGCAG